MANLYLIRTIYFPYKNSTKLGHLFNLKQEGTSQKTIPIGLERDFYMFVSEIKQSAKYPLSMIVGNVDKSNILLIDRLYPEFYHLSIGNGANNVGRVWEALDKRDAKKIYNRGINREFLLVTDPKLTEGNVHAFATNKIKEVDVPLEVILKNLHEEFRRVLKEERILLLSTA